MKKRLTQKALSVLLAVLLAVTGLLPATAAFAGDGVEGYYDLQIFYGETDTIVPTYEEDGVTKYKEYMFEGDELQLKYKLIDSVFPDNGYVKWYSEAPALADVDQTGKVKAFDSSKGAVVRLWIDNEVRTIPILGKVLAPILEKAFFNQYVDLDSMDNDAIIAILEETLGSNSIIADQIESYEGELIDSLRTYLDKINSNIHCVLYDGDGNQVADDVVQIVVKRNKEWYANFLPNGTHFTNKAQVPTTVAKGSQVQLYAITTPQRLGFGTVYSVKSSSIFTQGRVVATVDDSGLVKFKNTGTCTIMASPDSEDVVEALLKFINYFYELENTGTIDTQKAADILIKYIGIDINRTVLAGILDACFAVADIVGDTADPVQLTATAVEVIANLCLQFAYNDTIDFTVVEAQPLESFDIEGVNSVKEGTQVQLVPTNLVPTVGDVTDIVWRSSDPSVACVDPETGVVTGLDAGGSLGALSSQTCTIYALSTTNNIERSITMTVTGKTGKYISKVDINGLDTVGIEEEADFTYTIYPKRVAESENLYTKWGVVSGVDEEGNPTYTWANADEPAVDPDGVAQIDAMGHFIPLSGGTTTIAFQAQTGYLLSDGSFYEISSYIATKEVETGIPVENIRIGVTERLTSDTNGKLSRNETITINGQEYTYATVKIGVGNMYFQKGVNIKATVEPAEATDQNLTWVVDNKHYDTKISSDTHSIDVTHGDNHEQTDTFNIYAVSNDGEVKSNVITVCVTRNDVTSNVIDQEEITMINGKDTDATHTLTFDGTWTSRFYACYGANWYSSDEEIFSVSPKGNDNYDAVLHANDVGTATLYCVSADGAFIDSIEVTVKPDKQYLEEIVNICDKSIVLHTKHNRDYYKTYMRKLDMAYTVLYEADMASQTVVDTTAAELLAAFIKVGGFVGISDIEMKATNKEDMTSDYVTVKVGSTKNYKNYSYDFDFEVKPAGAMYSKEVWTSSNSSISVDENGVCRPTSNDPCSADITCTVTDYNGTTVSDTKHIAFARTKATGVELDTYRIIDAKIGETRQLKPTVLPKNVLGKSEASVEDVTWFSTNENVVTVNKDGVLTYVYGGNATIICTTADGGFTAECNVTVDTNYNHLELLIKQLDDLSLNEVSYYPDTWAPYIEAKTEAERMVAEKNSSQEDVDAQYNKLNTAYKNLKKFVDIQKVELYLDGEPTSEFYQYDLRLLKEGLSYKNAQLDLNVRLYPNNATYQSVVWTSSTTAISVSSDGVCSPTANKSCYGSITCTVTDAFGNEYQDSVWVSFSYNPVTGVSLSKDSIVGEIGTTQKLTVTIEPVGSDLLHIAAADIKDYFWESDDPKVASVDQDGTVHFNGAGSTIVRCVSYDGGVSGECKVSAEGDRTALKEAIQLYKDVDYTNYEYNYGMAFKNAYDEALVVLDDKSKTQDEIDRATSNLVIAAEALADHPYKSVENIVVTYQTQKRSLTNAITSVASGMIGTNSAVSVNLSSGYSNYNDYNDIILTASNSPSGTMFKTVNWEVLETSNMNVSSNALAKITLTPSESARSGNASARVKAIYTDHYGRTTEREIWVSMSDTVCTGITVEETDLNMAGTADPYQLTYSTTGNASGYNNRVIFTTSDENVATVSASGVVSPVDAGSCVITAKTLDGGYTQTVNVSVYTDFSKLAQKVNEYEALINDVKDKDQFTEESLNALGEQVDICKAMVNEGKASQREVNAALAKLEQAYNNLTGYIPATGITVSLNDNQENITEVNPHFVRYKSTALNKATVQLAYKVAPDDAMYEGIEWTSSTSTITVDETGKVTNTSAVPGAAAITATVTTVYGDSYSDTYYVSFVRYAVEEVGFTTDLVYGAPHEQKQVPVELKTTSNLASVTPSVENCLYESLDETIATVDGDGLITFRTQGTTQIKVTSIDGGLVGYINVQTTWDTTALQEAITQANALVYTDYEYTYGMQLKTDREAAEAIYANPNASQQEIDTACTKLVETINSLEGHEFVLPVVTMTANDTVVTNGLTFEAIDGVLRVAVEVNGTMYKSCVLSTENEVGLTSSIGNKEIVLNKNEVGTDATVTVKAVVIDDYDRETVYSYDIIICDKIVSIDDISITLDGEVVTSVTKSGFSLGYTDFTGFTLGYVSNTASSANPIAVAWTSSAPDYITIDENGTVGLTTLARAKSENNANITCTVTNPDGTTVSTKIPVTIKRK